MGLDIAKQVFQVHRTDKSGWTVLRRKLKRNEVVRFFCELEPCVVGIEASGSAHYWARVLGGLGHTVRLMAPQFVKPYVKSQKNDANDAEAVCEAVTRPNMRFVPQKPVEQQDLQCLHRVRSRLVACRTQPINQVRGLLAECGIVLAQHPGQVRRGLSAVLEDAENQLTGFGRELFHGLYAPYRSEKIAQRTFMVLHRCINRWVGFAVYSTSGATTPPVSVAFFAEQCVRKIIMCVTSPNHRISAWTYAGA